MEWNILLALILNSAVFFILGRMSLKKKFNSNERKSVRKHEQKQEICGIKKCNEPVYEFGRCFKHYCQGEEM